MPPARRMRCMSTGTLKGLAICSTVLDFIKQLAQVLPNRHCRDFADHSTYLNSYIISIDTISTIIISF
jgi:hypothetical protein